MSAVVPVDKASKNHTAIIQIIRLLATRMLWSSGKPLIASTGLPTSRGWQETISTIASSSYSEQHLITAYSLLSDAAVWHTFVGNKHVTFFDIRAQNKDAQDRLKTWTLTSSLEDLKGVVKERPFNILNVSTQQNELEKYRNTPPKLISTALKKGALYLQYFSTRAYWHKDTLEVGTMPEEQAKFFQEYQEIIGVKTKLVPCFDTVVVNTNTDLVEFRVDFAPGLNGDKAESAFAKVMSEFNRTIFPFLTQYPVGVGLLNLHPAIDPIYRDEECGSVRALGFVATAMETSSNNQGQIHRRKNQDFRKDGFHVGGKMNVQKIEPYAIGVAWPKMSEGELYLELKGSAKALYAGKLIDVSVAEFLGCMDGNDYDFLADHLLSRLPRLKK